MTVYEGRCIGGPLAGKDLADTRQSHTIFEPRVRISDLTSREAIRADIAGEAAGFYNHRDGAWHWEEARRYPWEPRE